MKDDRKKSDAKKPIEAKIVKLKKDQRNLPLDDLLNALQQINNDIETHWKEEESESGEEEPELWIDYLIFGLILRIKQSGNLFLRNTP